MTKFSLLSVAALAVVSVGLAAAPALATATVASYCTGSDPQITRDADLILSQLKRQGVDATAVRDWGGCIQAFVTDSKGDSKIAYFDPLTLEPIPVDSLSSMAAG